MNLTDLISAFILSCAAGQAGVEFTNTGHSTI